MYINSTISSVWDQSSDLFVSISNLQSRASLCSWNLISIQMMMQV